MSLQFHKHYSVNEARALLPQVREWLTKLQQVRRRLDHLSDRISQMIAGGNDVGASLVNENVRLISEVNDLLGEFRSREIQIKDLDRGLIDFPAIIGGREVFLCWEQDEEDIEHWHELDAGYAGREKL